MLVKIVSKTGSVFDFCFQQGWCWTRNQSKRQDRKWICLPWAEEFPVLWELVSNKLGHNQEKKPSSFMILINRFWKSSSGENRIFFIYFTKRTNCNRGKRLEIMQDYLWHQQCWLQSTAEITTESRKWISVSKKKKKMHYRHSFSLNTQG